MPDDKQEQSGRDQDLVAYTAFSGLRNDVRPERFERGDLAVAQNIDLDKTGEIRRRWGYTLSIAGATHSVWANPQETICLFVQGNVLYSLSTDMYQSAIATLQYSGPVSYEQVNDRVYFSNGVDTGVIEQAAVRSWGVAPPNLPDIEVGTGYMPCGTYLVTSTWLMVDGQESGAPQCVTVQIDEPGGALLFSNMVPPANPRIAGRYIYITEPNGENIYQALLFDADATSGAYANDTTELNLPLDSAFLQPAPPGQLVAYYRGRMFVAQGDLLFPSEPFSYERFDPRANLQLDGRITMIGTLTDKELYDTGKNSGLFIGTDRSCGVIIGSSPEDFQYVPKTTYGAVFGTMVKMDGSVFEGGETGTLELPAWLTTKGICVGMPGMTVRNLTRTRFQFPVGTQGAGLFMQEPDRLVFTTSS
jgi:hypothetical protein